MRNLKTKSVNLGQGLW